MKLLRPLPLPAIQPLSEDSIDAVIIRAGGNRLSDAAHLMRERNADYLIGKHAIELKILEEEGFDKPDRQSKLAKLFAKNQPGRPVVVVDTRLLPENDVQEYIRIMDGPIRNAVAKARTQIKQTKKSHLSIDSGALFILNNNFSAITHEELLDYVVRRAKNDTKEIDNVIVAGCYLHSDGFDTYALWPIDCVNINGEKPLGEYQEIKKQWNFLANRHMSDFVRGEHGETAKKGANVDLSFDIDGITYIKPTIPIGKESSFYGFHRPRANTLQLDEVPHVATTIPNFPKNEYKKFRKSIPIDALLHSYDAWLRHIEEAIAAGTDLLPTVPMRVDRDRWIVWLRRHPTIGGLESLKVFANEIFNRKISLIVRTAENADNRVVFPRKYIAINIELIGQSEKNDISNIALASRRSDEQYFFKSLVVDARIGHNHAVCLAAAYAIKNNTSSVYWHHDTKFAWF